VNVDSEGDELGGGKMLRFDFFAVRLNAGITFKKRGVPLRTLQKARSRASKGTLSLRLSSDTEQAGDKVSLAECVAFCQPPDPSLVDHVHGFDSLQRPPRTLKRAVSFREPDPLLHGSVILFDDVVEVLALAEAYPPRQRRPSSPVRFSSETAFG
jgi:hypothetical protein